MEHKRGFVSSQFSFDRFILSILFFQLEAKCFEGGSDVPDNLDDKDFHCCRTTSRMGPISPRRTLVGDEFFAYSSLDDTAAEILRRGIR